MEKDRSTFNVRIQTTDVALVGVIVREMIAAGEEFLVMLIVSGLYVYVVMGQSESYFFLSPALNVDWML
jgi:hypothetical protein